MRGRQLAEERKLICKARRRTGPTRCAINSPPFRNRLRAKKVFRSSRKPVRRTRRPVKTEFHKQYIMPFNYSMKLCMLPAWKTP